MVHDLWALDRISEARDVARRVPGDVDYKFFMACSNHLLGSGSANVDKEARDVAAILATIPDPETRYVIGSEFVFCGQSSLAFPILKKAIEDHYCAYDALEKDPLLKLIQGTPELAELRTEAKQCRDNFLAQRDQIAH
ncbi:MAG TPA: hypothetical protein VMX38_05515 [Verrucomicrobiae bacterium]|jgi:hypothetical protein|nr:hypothetical protein [Verrucomicrobiae bacterium]